MKPKHIFFSAFLICVFCAGPVAQQNSSGNDKQTGLNSLYNTPNPFSETTTIKFVLSQDCYVKLSAVETNDGSETELVNGLLSAGEHGIIFKAPKGNGREYKCILNAYSETGNTLLYTREIDMRQQ